MTVGTVSPRGWARAAARVRVLLAHGALDRDLARGRSPWATGALMTRAAQLSSPAGRRQVGRALEGLVTLAEHHPPIPARTRVRRRTVAEHAEAIRSLAARLQADAPVDVAVVAQLAVLVWDRSSPALATGAAPETLGPLLDRCARTIDRDPLRSRA